jgi:hypothetical protein
MLLVKTFFDNVLIKMLKILFFILKIHIFVMIKFIIFL